MDCFKLGDPLDRKGNPGDAVHLDFLRSIAGMPLMSHKWTMLAELGRQPLLVQWLALRAGSGNECSKWTEPGRLLP